MDCCKASILLLISFVLSVTAENVPVLIWETKSSNSSKNMPPGLAKISSSDFLRIFDDKLLSYRNPPLVLVFVEEKLSMEDFGWRNKTDQGSFPQLTALTNRSARTTFFPSVSEPIIGLKQALFQRGFTMQTLNLKVKSFQNPDRNLNLESVQSISHVPIPERRSPNADLNANSFHNQNFSVERVQSIDKNTEKAKITDDVSESIPKLDQVRTLTEKIAEEISAPNAIMFRLSATNPVESRPCVLHRHDEEIVLAFRAQLSTQADIIGVYTAHAAAFNYDDRKLRSRRQDETLPQPPPQASYGPQVWSEETGTILLYFHTFPPLYESLETKVKEVVVAESIAVDKAAKYLQLLVKGAVGSGEVYLAFCFLLTTSYWELAKIEITVSNGQTVDLLPSSADLVVARGYSYTCRGDVVFTDGKTRLTMANFQMQAFMTTPKFSNSQDCVTYFTLGIWSGVAVMLVMTVVLSWAITMIMNIKVNDKYDDRFGKTIHVGAGN